MNTYSKLWQRERDREHLFIVKLGGCSEGEAAQQWDSLQTEHTSAALRRQVTSKVSNRYFFLYFHL